MAHTLSERYKRQGNDNDTKWHRIGIYVHATFARNWDPKETSNRDSNNNARRSRHHGYIVVMYYENCPIIWKSQLQMEVALSLTESEYTGGLSSALRYAVPMMKILATSTLLANPISLREAKGTTRNNPRAEMRSN